MSWTTTKTSASYTPVILIWPDGRTERKSALSIRVDTVEQARAKLAAGKAAWVREGDATALLACEGREVARDDHG